MTDNNSMSNQKNGQSHERHPHCLVADASVFIGFTTIPLGGEGDFIDKIENFFKNYRDGYTKTKGKKKGLCDYIFPSNVDSTEKQKFQRYFYKPSMYYMFGALDLAVLSLIEDFEFPVQTFAPCDPDWPCDTSQPPDAFAHRVIVGPAPRWKENERVGAYDDNDLVRLASETFLRNPPLPLIGICQIEVNTSFLIGGGTTFLRCLIKAIESLFRLKYRENNMDQNTHIIILESYSWHELTLLIFSDSYVKIKEFVLAVRSMDLAEMGVLLLRDQIRIDNENKRKVDEQKTKSYRLDWYELRTLPNVYELATTQPGEPNSSSTDGNDTGAKILNLLKERPADGDFSVVTKTCNLRESDYKTYQECLKVSRGEKPFGTHVIFNTTTNLGFSAVLLRRALEKVAPNAQAIEEVPRLILNDYEIPVDDLNRSLYLIRRWTAKAGHDALGAETVTLQNLHWVGTVGRSDFISPYEFGPLTSRELVEHVVTQLLRLNRYKSQNLKTSEPQAGLLTPYTTVAVDIHRKESDQPKVVPGHVSADEVRRVFAVPRDKIDITRNALRKLNISKVVTERVLNAIALFNDGIQDNFTFSTFLELRPFLEKILVKIENEAVNEKRDVNKISNTLNTLIDNFEIAWCNRFYGGWRLGEVTDFNIDFKGGIQQLLSAIHGAYRLISWALNGDDATLALVTGDPGISVEHGALKLNFFDLFKPSFFASRVGHEASEQLLEATETILKPVGAEASEDWVKWLRRVQTYAWVWLKSGREPNPEQGKPQEFTIREFRKLLRQIVHNLKRNDNRGMVRYREFLQKMLEIHKWLPKFQAAFNCAKTILQYSPENAGSYNNYFTEKCQEILQLNSNVCIDLGLAGWITMYLNGEVGIRELAAYIYAIRNEIEELKRAVEQTGDSKATTLMALIKGLTESHQETKTYNEIINEARSYLLLNLPPAVDDVPTPLRAICRLEPQLEFFIYETTNPRLFDQVFADICNFVILFGGDEELYVYRFLGDLVIDPSNWDERGKISKARVRETLLRLFLVLLAKPSDSQSQQQSIDHGKPQTEAVEGKTPAGRQSQEESIAQVKELVSDYFRELRKFCIKDIDSMINETYELAKRLRNKVIPDWFECAYNLASEPIGFIKYRIARERLVQADLEESYNEALKCLTNGRVFRGGWRWRRDELRELVARNNIPYSELYNLDRWFDFCDVVGLLRAYLHLLKEESKAERKKYNNILRLYSDGNPVIKGANPPYARFHPRGGVFTIDPIYRRRSFRLRAVLIMSLFDISEKAKFSYCRFHLERNKDRLDSLLNRHQ